MAFGWNETGGSLPFGPKPQVAAINWRDPITRGLVFYTNYGLASAQNGKDLVSGLKGTYTGTGLNTGPFGFHRTFLSSTDMDAYTTPATVNGLHKISVEFLAKFNVDTFGAPFGKGPPDPSDGQNFFVINWDDTSHCISVGASFTTSSGSWVSPAVVPPNQFTHILVTYDDTSLSNTASIYVNGALQTLGGSISGVGSRGADSTVLQVGNQPTYNFGVLADMEYLRVWNRILTAQEVRALAGNPWIVDRWPPPLTAANVPATGSHAATGALTGPGSTIAGTAKRFRAHPSSGALTGPGSSVAGTAKRFRAHPSSGALTGPGATIVGTAHRAGSVVTHPSSGVLVGPGASISGQAARRSRIDPGWPLVEGLRKRRKKKDQEIEAAWEQRKTERQQLKDQLRQAMRGPQAAPQPVAAKIEMPKPATVRKIRDSEDDDIEFLLLHG